MFFKLLRLVRPDQWTKNAICFAGALFGGRMGDPSAVLSALYTFAVFCAASSATYVVNDILDRERDREHPRKRGRPIASGALGVLPAAVVGVLLAAAGAAGGWLLGPHVFFCVVAYMVNGLAYSARLKHLVLLDVLSIALGFVLRLLGGIYVLDDLPTSWIVLCTFFLALFLGFAKRRAELRGLADQANLQRPVLHGYSLAYLDSLLSGAATLAVLCYALFTVTSGRNPTLVVTLPIVYYAIMHYKRLVIVREVGEEPDRILVKEHRLILCVVLWLAAYLAIEHWDLRLFR